MPQFDYQASAPENGLVAVSFDSKQAAENFAKAMYRWHIVNAKNGFRVPVEKNGRFVFKVSETEFARIEQNNAHEPESTFDVFSPLMLNAAERVRRDFMSTPYKGAQHAKLEKKDFDEFEMVDFYNPPTGTWESTTGKKPEPGYEGLDEVYKYRTDVEKHANMAAMVLERAGKGKKEFKPRYEVSIEGTPYTGDPATGYELSTLEVDDINGIDAHPEVQKWVDEKDDDKTVDSRVLAIKCGNRYRLYAYDMQAKKFQEINESRADRYLRKLFEKHPPEKTLNTVSVDSEIERDVIKMGKCFGHHPTYNNLNQQENMKAWSDSYNIIRQLAASAQFKDKISVELYKTYDRAGKPIQDYKYFFDKPEDAQAFQEAIEAKRNDEAKKFYNITKKKEWAAKVSPDEYKILLEQLPGDYIVRPNHGFTHSVRVAGYVPVLVEHYKAHGRNNKCKDMDHMDVRMAQLAMLYSVVGRETEVGFGSQAKTIAARKKHDAEIDRIKPELDEARAAGNDDEVERLTQLIADIEIKKQREIEKLDAQGEEYYRYRETSALAFLKYAQDSGFADAYKAEKGETITLDVNTSFGTKLIKDLQRLGLAKLKPAQGYTAEKSDKGYKITIDRMHYLSAVLFSMSSPDYQNNLDDGFADIFAKAHGLDLMRCYSKHPSHPSSFSIGSIVDSLDIGKSEASKESALNVCKFAIKSLKATGNRLTVGLDEDGNIIDHYTPADYNRNLPSAAQTKACVENLSEIEEPAIQRLAVQLGSDKARFSASEDIEKLKDQYPIVQGVKRNSTNDKQVDMRFESAEQMRLFAELIVQAGLLPASYLDSLHDSDTLTVDREYFDGMQGTVRYRQVKVPEVHNEEEGLVNENGEIAGIQLVKDCKGLVRNFDGAKQRTLEFNFKQLNDPINNRPPSRMHKGHQAHRLAYDRLILMDMTKDDITDTIKDCEFDIDEEIHEFKTWEEAQAHLKAFKEAHKDDPPQRFRVFRHKYSYINPNDGKTYERVDWRCYARDNSGRWQDKLLNFQGTLDEFKANHNEIMMQAVVYYGFYKRLTRGTQDYIEPERQIPFDADGRSLQSKKEDYYKYEEIVAPDGTRERKLMGKPVHRFEDRGKPQNTIYTKKAATTLMRPDGKTELFNPDGWDEYMPVGMLYDLDKCFTLGERFIWESDAYTDDRFWLGDLAQHKQQCYEFNKGGQNLTLAQLQEKLRDAAARGEDPTKWNELLVCMTKAALKGLFVQDDTPAARMIMMHRYKQIKDKYKIDVPVFVMDGTHEPRMYREADFKVDLKRLLEAKASGDYSAVFNPKKKADIQLKTLNELLETLDYKNIAKQSADLDEQVEALCEKMDMIGGLKREKAFLEAKWDDDNPDAQFYCIKRANALGYHALVRDFRHRQGNDDVEQDVRALISDEAKFAEMRDVIKVYEDKITAIEEEMATCLENYPLIKNQMADIQKSLDSVKDAKQEALNDLETYVVKELETDTIKLNEAHRQFIREFLPQHEDLKIHVNRLDKATKDVKTHHLDFEADIVNKHDEYKQSMKAMMSKTITDIQQDLAQFASDCSLKLTSEQMNEIGFQRLNKIIGDLYKDDQLDNNRLMAIAADLDDAIKHCKKNVNAIQDPKSRGWFASKNSRLDNAKQAFRESINGQAENYHQTVMIATKPLKDNVINEAAISEEAKQRAHLKVSGQ